jgi:uncharacterized iron-regulated protein
MIKHNFALLSVTLLLTGCAYQIDTKPLTQNLEKKETIYSIKQAKKIDIKELVKETEHYPIIFIGDHHNNKKTHEFFQNVLKEFDKNGYNLYLANEWFTSEHDELLKDYTDGKLDGIRLKERRHWDQFTKYKWEYVEPLYEVVKKNGGRLYGMNISKQDREKISLKQFDKMSDEEKSFYDSLDLEVTAHKQLVAPFLEHCNKMPSKSSEPCEQRMYRVQVTWDTYMAQNVAKIAKKVIRTPKDKLFVFAGAMHIEQNLGIPLRFARLCNLPFISVSNKKIEKDEALKLDINQADIIYIYE